MDIFLHCGVQNWGTIYGCCSVDDKQDIGDLISNPDKFKEIIFTASESLSESYWENSWVFKELIKNAASEVRSIIKENNITDEDKVFSIQYESFKRIAGEPYGYIEIDGKRIETPAYIDLSEDIEQICDYLYDAFLDEV